MASTPALIAFATATVFEIGGYYIPFVDNILDTITTPASVAAGTLLTASLLTPEMDPMLKWGLGIIVGGGSAGVVQAGTALTRAHVECSNCRCWKSCCGYSRTWISNWW
jgi:hypothetical protein